MTHSPRLSRRHALALFAGAFCATRLTAARAQAQGQAAVEQNARFAAGLYEIVFSASQNRLYAAAAGVRGADDARLFAVDPGTLKAKSFLELGDEPAFGLGLNDRRHRLYTTNTRSGSVSVIDTQSGKLLGKLAEGEKAHVRQVVVDDEKDVVYVSVFGARGAPSQVWVIDGATQKIAHVLQDGLEGGITGLALDRAGNRLFATALQSNEIVEIDLGSRAVKRRFASGGEGAVNVAYDPAGRRLFVTNQKSGTLTVLDAGSGALVKSIETGAGALSLALNPPRGLVLVANRQAGTVSLVDAASLTVRDSLVTGTHPQTIAVDPTGGRAWVTNKARSAPRGQPPVEDPQGDTVSLIRL